MVFSYNKEKMNVEVAKRGRENNKEHFMSGKTTAVCLMD